MAVIFFIMSFGGRKAETGSVVILPSGPQNGIGKVGMVGCIGEPLGFQAEGVMLAVFRTAPCPDRRESVELDAGLGGLHDHGDACNGREGQRGGTEGE